MQTSRPGNLDREPLAYFITFRCDGTWLPGDERGWTHKPRGVRDLPLRSGHPSLRSIATDAMEASPFVMEGAHRRIADTAIRDVCAYRGWTLHALNVRTNHVHLVVSADPTAEQVMTSLKAWSTRRLREDGLIAEGFKPWSRHGSTRYLWELHEVEATVWFFLEEQGTNLT
jgi:REP element-mobilizing transposase RayT